MQKKKVLLLTYGNLDHASSRIRAINHFNRLQDTFKTTWVPRVGKSPKNSIWSKIYSALEKRSLFLLTLIYVYFGDFDIVFIQVLFLPEFLLKYLKKKGTIICFDFDDAVYKYSSEKFDIMMSYATKVIVATPFLANYVQKYGKSCEVIFSPVDTQKIIPNSNKTSVFTIGWIGSPWTSHYLLNLSAVLKELESYGNFEMIIVGAKINIEGINLTCIEWSESAEIEILKRIDVGIMPLDNDDWALMKGGYKLYLYMAAGKPIIASPYGINSLIVKDGVNGFKAESDKQWLDSLVLLQKRDDLRKELGRNARIDAEAKYSYTVCTKQLSDFLNK